MLSKPSFITISCLLTSLIIAEEETPPFSKKNEVYLVAELSEQNKKPKAHYAGVKKPKEKEEKEVAAKKRSSRIKNKWVSSKTHPKQQMKDSTDPKFDLLEELPEDRPYFQKASYILPSPTPQIVQLESPDLMEEKSFEKPFFQSVYLTGEWLFWRVRQEGMEYAAAKSVEFKFSSGFRLGLGVHLPRPGWDIFVNYANIAPDQTVHSHGPIFPRPLYQAIGAVNEASAHWKIGFQSVDIELGKTLNLASTFQCRPYLGLKGAWIDQNAHFLYQGGIVPAGEEYTVRLKNDFKGAGPRIGVRADWEFGRGWSLFADTAAAFLIGVFNEKEKQQQLNGNVPIDMTTTLHLISPNLQLATGVDWSCSFKEERYRVGLSAGFEAQMYWDQNQTSEWTSSDQPLYVRVGGDLGFYGLTLKGRFDF